MSEETLLIDADRSISIAANMAGLGDLERVVSLTSDVKGVLSYTIGRGIGLNNLRRGIEIVREFAPNAKVLYEHHKAGTEDADSAQEYVDMMYDLQIDGVVVFYGEDLQSHRRWLDTFRIKKVKPVVGPEITRHRHLGEATVGMVLRQAVQLGVKDIWVRGDDPGRVARYHNAMRATSIADQYTLWVPRWVDRQGNVPPRRRLERRFVAVIGGAICKADDPRKEALRLSEQLIDAE